MLEWRNDMKDSGFAGSLIVAGAILIAGTEIANGFFGMFLGIPLICWGIIERVVTRFKNKKQK